MYIQLSLFKNQSELLINLDVIYEPKTGVFTKYGEKCKLPKNKDNYQNIFFMGKNYNAGRLAYKLSGIQIKDGMYIDHIDRNKENYKSDNLRQVTPSQNIINRQPYFYLRNGKEVYIISQQYLKNIPTLQDEINAI